MGVRLGRTTSRQCITGISQYFSPSWDKTIQLSTQKSLGKTQKSPRETAPSSLGEMMDKVPGRNIIIGLNRTATLGGAVRDADVASYLSCANDCSHDRFG